MNRTLKYQGPLLVTCIIGGGGCATKSSTFEMEMGMVSVSAKKHSKKISFSKKALDSKNHWMCSNPMDM
jgi:hypothetical protein